MKGFILKRTLQAVIISLLISFITFSMIFLAHDPAMLLAGPEARREDIEIVRKAYRLDDPVVVQYGRWLWKAVHGDFGKSFYSKEDTMELVAQRLPYTLLLATTALALCLSFSIPLGILAAIKKNSLMDNLATVIAVLGQAMPLFWLGIMLGIIFGVELGWLPISGSGTIWHLILPALCLGYYISPVIMRMTRSGMLDVLKMDYIRTARSKGLPRRRVLIKHALRNALIPIITLVAVQFGFLMGGSVITETVFSWPGVGRLAVDSIINADFPVVQAIVLILSMIFVLANLAADLLNALVDPRIRYE
jgi:peptide/nickel transport system permease protein